MRKGDSSFVGGGEAVGPYQFYRQIARARLASIRGREPKPEGGRIKIQILTTIAALALFVTLAAGSASAQSANIMKVTVPFDFVISHKTLPAGDYVVRRRIEGALVVLAIQNEDKNESAYLIPHTVQARDLQPESKLVFNQYGDQYFLSQVWLWPQFRR